MKASGRSHGQGAGFGTSHAGTAHELTIIEMSERAGMIFGMSAPCEQNQARGAGAANHFTEELLVVFTRTKPGACFTLPPGVLACEGVPCGLRRSALLTKVTPSCDVLLAESSHSTTEGVMRFISVDWRNGSSISLVETTARCGTHEMWQQVCVRLQST